MEGNSVDNKKKIVKKKFKAGLNKIKISDGETRKKRKFRRKAGAVIYLGCIPHGFYEDQMTSYFSQFGRVLDARVARSAKTGRSKSFGFVEFEDEDVAKIAAETMNNYLMFNRIIKCKYIPPEERKGKFLRQIEANNYPRKLRRKEEAQKKLNSIEKLDQQTYLKKVQKKINAFKKYFEEQGIDFSLNLDTSDSPKQGRSTPSKSNSRSNTSTSSQSQSDPNEQFGVLEIDESDSDIHFETPPQVKKIIKRSLDSTVRPAKKLKTGKTKSKMENLKLMEPVSTISKEKQEVKKEQKKKNSVNKSKGLSVKVPQVKTTQQKKKLIPQAAGKNPGKKNEKSHKQGKVATAKGARKTRT